VVVGGRNLWHGSGMEKNRESLSIYKNFIFPNHEAIEVTLFNDVFNLNVIPT